MGSFSESFCVAPPDALFSRVNLHSIGEDINLIF